MNKKTKIQIAIITVMFASSAVVLYMGFYKPTPARVPGGLNLPASIADKVPASLSTAPDALLPYGGELDFKGIDDKRFNYDLSVIKVNPSDVGISTDNLIKINTPNP